MLECRNCKLLAEQLKRSMDLIESLVRQVAPRNEEIHPSLRRQLDGDYVPVGEGPERDD